MNYALGKLAATYDPKMLAMVSYLDVSTIKVPDVVDLTAGIVSWPLDSNDKMGDCTAVALAHMFQRWTLSSSGQELVMAEADVIDFYRHFSPAPSDTGAAIRDVLVRARDVGIAGHQIDGFVSVSVSDPRMIKLAAWLFEGLDVGLLLPLTARAQIGTLWDVVPGDPGARPASWGGHCVNVIAVDLTGVTVATWGKPQRMTWAFWQTYCDEAYAVMPREFNTYADTVSPEGFFKQQLADDMRAVRG